MGCLLLTGIMYHQIRYVTDSKWWTGCLTHSVDQGLYWKFNSRSLIKNYSHFKEREVLFPHSEQPSAFCKYAPDRKVAVKLIFWVSNTTRPVFE
jgi:hypothetical protein